MTKKKEFNILTPKLIVINGRQYRSNPYTLKTARISEDNEKLATFLQHKDENMKFESKIDSKEGSIGTYEITKNDEGITLEMKELSPFYFSIIHERYMKVIKNMMAKTGVSIIVPKASIESQHISRLEMWRNLKRCSFEIKAYKSEH